MKSDSLNIRAANLDALATVLRDHYDECEVASQSGDSRLVVVEKYYFGNNSHSLGVTLIETTGDRIFHVTIYAGGGRSGLFGIDHPAEEQFVDELKKILLTAGEEIAIGQGDYETGLAKAQQYTPYSRPDQKKKRM
jgi:hypothetical protein